MNRTAFAIVGLVGLGALIGLSVSAGFAEPTAEVRPDAEKITILRKERIDALLEASKAAQQEYEIGRIDFATVRRLKSELMDAELDLTTDHAARVAIRRQFVLEFRKIEQAIAERAAIGVIGGTRLEQFESKAVRLKAEIDLTLESDEK